MYSIPESGLNTRDVSWYANSAHTYRRDDADHVLCDESDAANLQNGSHHDARGFTALYTSRDVEPGEELVYPYDIAQSGRMRATIEGNRIEKHAVAALPSDGICRVCLEPLRPEERDQAEDGELVNIGCDCDSTMHLKCATKWFTQRIGFLFTQAHPASAVPEKVGVIALPPVHH